MCGCRALGCLSQAPEHSDPLHSVTPQGRNLWLFLCDPGSSPAFLQSSLCQCQGCVNGQCGIFDHHQTITCKAPDGRQGPRPLPSACGALIWPCRTTVLSGIMAWSRQCLLSDLSDTWNCHLLPVQSNSSHGPGVCVTLQNKLGKKCPLPKGGDVSHLGCARGFPAVFPPGGRIAVPAVHRDCSVTCSEVFLLHTALP